MNQLDVQPLIDEAEEALENCDYDIAIRIGKRLLKVRHSYGFEALARAFWAREKKKKAIRTLEKGLRVAPGVGQLWHLLGNYSSDEGDFGRAYECYERALELSGAEDGMINLNYAIALSREKRHEDALVRLDRIGAGEVAIEAASTRAFILNALHRHDEAIEIARAAVAEEFDDRRRRADLHHAIAHGLWSKGEGDAALESCWEAVGAFPSHQDAMWLIREIESRYSPAAKAFKVMVSGKRPDVDAAGFYVNYQVVADDEREAMELIARFEPENARPSLAAHQVKTLRGDHSKEPKGVYWRSGYLFFEKEED